MARFAGVLGMAVLLGLAYLFSTARKAIQLKTVLWGLGLQLAFGVFVLKFGIGRRLFEFLGDIVNKLLSFAFAGSEFVFGQLGVKGSSFGFIFAFQVLPTIIFIAAVFAFLYHIGVMQVFIRAFAWVMTRVMGASGAESLDIAASIFMGQTEAPLTIRPFLNRLTKSELMCVMTCGMAHVSGGIMAAYIASGVEAKHLLTAVIMTAPGTLLMAKMLVPETEQPLTAGRVQMPEMEKEANFLGAISRGTSDGLQLAINVGAMLISFIALLALLDYMVGGTHNWLAAHHVPWFPTSLEQFFGWIFAPVAWMIGIPWKDAGTIGYLLGTRMSINEVVAFAKLGQLKGIIGSTFVHDRYVRIVRVREFQFYRDSDRWDWRAGTRATRAIGAIWNSGDVGGNHGEFDVGLHRGNFDMRYDGAKTDEQDACVLRLSSCKPKLPPISSGRRRNCVRRLLWCLGRGWARLRMNSRIREKFRMRRFRIFRSATAIGHAGQLVIGEVEGVAVAGMQGRVHLYEGYSAKAVAFPIRVFARMGVQAVILTNAAGGIKTELTQGRLVVISDHINLQGVNPLCGANDENFGPRFPDMSMAYDKQFRDDRHWRKAASLGLIWEKEFMRRWKGRATKLQRRFGIFVRLVRIW